MNYNRYGLPGDIREMKPEEADDYSSCFEELTDHNICGHSTGKFTSPNRLYNEAVRDALKQVTLTSSGAEFFTVKNGDINLTRKSCDVNLTLYRKNPEYWPDKTSKIPQNQTI